MLLVAPQPFFVIRGTPLAVKELVNTFVKLGHKVDMLTFHLGEDLELDGLTIYRNKLFSGLIKNIPPGFSFKKFILDLVLLPKALLLIMKNNYNIVHCVEESAYFVSFMKCLKPFLFTYDMDSDIPEQLVYSGKIKNRFFVRLIKKIEEFTISRADAVVTICCIFTNKVKKWFPEKPVFQIEDVSVAETIPVYKPSDNEKIILYTGNFEKYQGVQLLIEAFGRIHESWPDLRLVLVGGEDDEICYLKKNHINSKITFTGKKPLSSMPDFLEKAFILVSPRIKGENTPYKIYSYLSSGRPVLATNIISHTQVLTDSKDSLLVDPTVEGVSEGLNRLLKNKDLAGRLSTGARKLFEEKYSRNCYEKKVKAYLDFMEDKVWKKK